MSHPDLTASLTRIFTQLEQVYATEKWHWAPEHVTAPFDIFASAVLVQHTTWTNAERALQQLRAAGALDPAILVHMDDEEIAALVRVSGTPSVKARRLRALAQMILDAGGLEALLALPAAELRARLLATHGIGPESADAIALYAAHARVFVIDAYTRRVFRRIGITPAQDTYDAWQRMFEDALAQADAAMFAHYHAYIVLHAKALCRPRPRCPTCPLRDECAYGAVVKADYATSYT